MNLKNSTTEQIRWQNAQSQANAAMLANNGGTALTKEQYKIEVEEYANFFYNIEPRVTELDKSINECTTIEQLEELKDIIKFTDSISMYNKWNAAKLSLSK